MKNVISYSLWGNNPKYWVGAIKNIELAKKYYPGWICKFYIDSNSDVKLIDKLKDDIVDIELVDSDFLGKTFNGNSRLSHQGMFWRFLTYEDTDVNYFISRDTDSRLSIREYDAVMQWMESGKAFHIMRDHPYHRAPILGGMWGAKADFLRKIDLKSKIIEWNKIKQSYQLGVDQDFLGRIIYPIVKDNSFEHSDFNIYYGNKTHKFKERENYEFIGDVFDENDERHPDYWKIIKGVG
jgi:hypothetical protein